MATDATTRISIWFNEHEDCEFVRLPKTHPYSATVPAPEARRIVYTTKPSCVLHALEQSDRVASIPVVGRPGLPNADDAGWLGTLAGDREILFLGDSDPADLLIFVWLRSQMPLTYVGVNDWLVRRLDVQVDDTVMIPLTNSERDAVSLLHEVCPDYQDLLGPQCSALLNQGRKLELEGVIYGGRGRTSLRDVFTP